MAKISQSSSRLLSLLRQSTEINVLKPQERKQEENAQKRVLTQQNLNLHKLMAAYLGTDVETIQRQISDHLEFTLAHSYESVDAHSTYLATAFSVRDRMIELWNDTQSYFSSKQVKRVYYLSIEFLMGRSLRNAVLNLRLESNYAKSLEGIGYHLEDLYEEEYDAALGNGGLGRLAACFLDSLATQNYPGWGYGIRYTYGMFKQSIHNGYQAETPDFWLARGNPWELERLDVRYPVQFGGYVISETDHKGKLRFRWEGGQHVLAVAYDTPIPGYGTNNTLNIRLWSSRPTSEFELDQFNRGDYYAAVEAKQVAENITSVLYPNDNTMAGKELRLQQEYFFVCATLQDIIRRVRRTDPTLKALPCKAAIQLNDTHPTLAIPELMRLLLDNEGMEWDHAWDLVVKTFGYTNHTVMPEALETWPIEVMARLLPRHLQIIFEINFRFLQLIAKKWPGDEGKLASMSIIQELPVKSVRMAILALVGSHSVNGVAKLHTEIVKNELFRDFYELWPEKFNNKTNGITPRRWILSSNPDLASLITATLGSDKWVTHLDELQKLKAFADKKDFQVKFSEVKHKNKERLAAKIKADCGVDVSPKALFDVQVKRIHEYKRQLLNILGVIYRYIQLKAMSPAERAATVPRVVIFAGKAAPGYERAKLIIKLITSVGSVVNNDEDIGDQLKVVFVPNYNVSLAEIIVPANDISQHISTAGTEASGTSNMKFASNGGIIIGTLDGANVEILEQVGQDNIVIFGVTTDKVAETRGSRQQLDPKLEIVLNKIQSGIFGAPDMFRAVVDTLWHGNDYYLINADFSSYLDAQARVDAAYKDQALWVHKAIMCTAQMGAFSSDRTIKEYADEIWDIKPCPIPLPSA